MNNKKQCKNHLHAIQLNMNNKKDNAKIIYDAIQLNM